MSRTTPLSADRLAIAPDASVHRRSPSRRHAAFAAVGLTLLLISCGGSAPTATERAAPIQLLDPVAFEQYLAENPGVDLINVHVPYQGHILGTDAFVHFEEILDYDGLPEDPDDPIVLYCRSGSMSGQAAAALAAAGYTNVVDLDGGMNAWAGSGRDLLIEEPVTDS